MGEMTFRPGDSEEVETDEERVNCTYCGGSGWIGEGKCDICRGSGKMPARYAKRRK